MHHAPAVYFDDVELGHQVGPLAVTPDGAAVREFCALWGVEPSSRFADAEAARREGLPGPIVPGVLSLAYVARLLGDWAAGGVVRRLDVVFRQLIVHDAPLEVAAVVTDKRLEDGERLVELDVSVRTAEGERAIGGTAVVALPPRP